MAAEQQTLGTESFAKPNTRSGTVLEHEMPDTNEIYETVLWDPEDELVFESESSQTDSSEEKGVDLGFEDVTDSDAPEYYDEEYEEYRRNKEEQKRRRQEEEDDDTSSVTTSTSSDDDSSTSSSSYDTPRPPEQQDDAPEMTLSPPPLGTQASSTDSMANNPDVELVEPHSGTASRGKTKSEPPTLPQSESNSTPVEYEGTKHQSVQFRHRKKKKKKKKKQKPEEQQPAMGAIEEDPTEKQAPSKPDTKPTGFFTDTEVKDETPSDAVTTEQQNDTIQTNEKTEAPKATETQEPKAESPKNVDTASVETEQKQEEKAAVQVDNANNEKTESKDTKEDADTSSKPVASVHVIKVSDDKKENKDTSNADGNVSPKPVTTQAINFKRKGKVRMRSPKKGSPHKNPQEKRKIIRKKSRAAKHTIPKPQIEDKVITEEDGTQTVIQVKMVHLFARCRSHHKLNNYKNMNYASKSYQQDPKVVLSILDQQKDCDRGQCKIGSGVYAFVKKNVGTQKEYKMALRANTDDINHAMVMLTFIESKLDESLETVKKITKFNHDVCIQSIISEMNKKD